VNELVARRQGVLWSTARETGLAARALVEQAARSPSRPPARLELRVLDGERRAELMTKSHDPRLPGSSSLVARIPARLLKGAPVLELRQKGGELVPYSMQLRWAKLTQGMKPLDLGIVIKRTCARLAPNEDGTTSLEPVGSKGVPRGSELRVTLSVDSHALEPIVIEEPLPAGARFLGEVEPSGVRLERRPGGLRLVFSGDGGVSRSFTYALRAERPGDWRALPARGRLESQGVTAGESEELFLRIKE
jgi:hypothetical protein